MKTIQIIDRDGKHHFIQNVMFWTFIDREFRISIDKHDVFDITIPHFKGAMGDKTKSIAIDISVIHKLREV
jgi:hypothetical protein